MVINVKLDLSGPPEAYVGRGLENVLETRIGRKRVLHVPKHHQRVRRSCLSELRVRSGEFDFVRFVMARNEYSHRV